MAKTIVIKFGGTSVRNEVSRAAALALVRKHFEAGERVAVVVSAMGRKGEPYATDTLIGLLASAGEPVAPRELDLVMSCGELLSAAFFAQLLIASRLPAKAFSGPQAGFLTEARAGAAEILSVSPARVSVCLDEGAVAVVAGFQGADADGEIRTLGRGGSDTSAVALGAALGADLVIIDSDVDGIAVADPRRVPAARFLAEIGAERMLEAADEGSKIMHPRAIRASLATRTPMVVRNTFSDALGTLIHHREAEGESRAVILAHRERQVLLALPSEGAEVQPELRSIGGDRHLLLDDVYLPGRLKLLSERFGELSSEKGWATASLIFTGDAPAPDRDFADTELLPSPSGCLRYLLREDDLDSVLNDLHEAYLA